MWAYSRKSDALLKMNMRRLTEQEIKILQSQNCIAEDWTQILVTDDFKPSRVRGVEFYGRVELGSMNGDIEVSEDFMKPCGINNATLRNVRIGDECLIENVRNYINNYDIGNGVLISNVCAIETKKDSRFGEGTVISVLNEVGKGNVMIFDGLNSQLASLMVKYEHDERLPKISEILFAEILKEKERTSKEEPSAIVFVSLTPRP